VADRVSTIRLKVAGGDDAARDIRKFMGQYRQQMEAANKMFAEAQGGMVMGVKPDKLKETFDTAVNLHLAAQNKVSAAMDSAWAKERTRDTARRQSIEEHSKIAAERDRKYAPLFQRLTDAERPQRKNELSTLKAGVLAREKAAQEQFKIESRAEAQREKLAAQTVMTQEKLAAQLTATRIKALEQYDRADAAEAAREIKRREGVIAAQQKQSNKLNGEADGGAPVDKKALGGFGAKMILGHASGMMAGGMTNDKGLGQIIGSTVGAALFGGPAVAAAVAGMETVGVAISTARESANDLADAQERHAEATRKSAAWMKALSGGYVYTTKAGAAYASQAQQESEAADASFKTQKKRYRELGYFSHGLMAIGAGISSGDMHNTSYDQSQAIDKKEEKDHIAKMERVRGYAVEERTIAAKEAVYGAQVAVKSAEDVAKYTDGPELKRRQLAARQGGEMHKYMAETREGNRQFEREKNELYNADKIDLAAIGRVNKEQKEYNKDRGQGQNLLEKKHGKEVDAQDRDFAIQVANEKMDAQQAHVNATEVGYQKEVDLLKIKHQKEQDDYKTAGRDKAAVTQLGQRQADENAALDFKRDKNATDTHTRMANQYKVARHEMRAVDAEWAEQERAAKEAGESTQQIRQRKLDFYAIDSAKRSEAIKDEVFQNKARRAMLEGADQKDTRVQMLMHQDHNLTREQAETVVQSQMEAETAQFAKQETRKLHPQREYGDYKRDMDRAVAQGSMTKDDEKYLLKQRARELLGGGMGGEVTNAVAHWQKVQSSIIQKDDLPKRTLEETRKLRDELRELNRGVKLAA